MILHYFANISDLSSRIYLDIYLEIYANIGFVHNSGDTRHHFFLFGGGGAIKGKTNFLGVEGTAIKRQTNFLGRGGGGAIRRQTKGT